MLVLDECRRFIGEWSVRRASWFLIDSVNMGVLPIASRGSGVLRRQHGVDAENTQKQEKAGGFHLSSYGLRW